MTEAEKNDGHKKTITIYITNIKLVRLAIVNTANITTIHFKRKNINQ